MVMLGNSTRGITPLQKCLLYRACVLPLATYGCRLWFYSGAKNKGVLKLLRQMQCQAAVWILGVFHTSPAGGVETIAGLPPIHLHIKKLIERSYIRTRTLLSTHPTLSLLRKRQDVPFRGTHHERSLEHLTIPEEAKIFSPIVSTDTCINLCTETFDPVTWEVYPGRRVRDLFRSRIQFDVELVGDKGLQAHLGVLDTYINNVNASTILVGADASVPKETNLQATAACSLIHGPFGPDDFALPSGRATSDDAELAAIDFAVSRAVHRDGASKLLLFSDLITVLKLALDPSAHSGQGHSISICSKLRTWLEADASHTVKFIHVPSKLEWNIHHRAHVAATALQVALGPRPKTYLAYARKAAIASMTVEWTRLHQTASYSGNHFLPLKDKGIRIPLSHLNGGPWLKTMGQSNTHTARMARSILGHAPIGEFRLCFNLSDEVRCDCPRRVIETRTHILGNCPKYARTATCDELRDFTVFLKFLEKNPSAFAFPGQAPPPPFPGARRKRARGPPDKDTTPVHRCSNERRSQRSSTQEGQANRRQPQVTGPDDIVWSHDLNDWVPTAQAIAEGWYTNP